MLPHLGSAEQARENIASIGSDVRIKATISRIQCGEAVCVRFRTEERFSGTNCSYFGMALGEDHAHVFPVPDDGRAHNCQSQGRRKIRASRMAAFCRSEMPTLRRKACRTL